jgi:hypothetical protein
MQGLTLRLKATRCPDGVELVHRETYPDIGWPRYGRSGPDWFSYRSARKDEFAQDAIDLENALVVRFVNATDDAKRITFLSRFGLPGDVLAEEGFVGIGIAEPRNIVLGRQRVLRRLLQDAGSSDTARATKAANEALRHGRPDSMSLELGGRRVWTMRCLMDFMYAEIVATVENEARLGSCKRCGCLFLYGKGTGRRETAKWCGASCRVGAHRANKSKRKGG